MTYWAYALVLACLFSQVMSVAAHHTIIEFCCFEDSQLGVEAVKFGSSVIRLTLAAADLATAAGLQHALQVVRDHPGSDLWGSLPCTTVIAIQNANIAKLGVSYSLDLQRRRRHMLCMFANFRRVAAAVTAHGGEVCFEWPRNCHGWRLAEVSFFFEDTVYKRVCVDGCTVGVVNAQGAAMMKPWAIRTTSSHLVQFLNGLTCPGNHEHASCHGSSATLSARYPSILARLIIHGLRQGYLARPRGTRISDVHLACEGCSGAPPGGTLGITGIAAVMLEPHRA